jgi:hypothetical protein
MPLNHKIRRVISVPLISGTELAARIVEISERFRWRLIGGIPADLMVYYLNFRGVAGRPNEEYFVALTPGRCWD